MKTKRRAECDRQRKKKDGETKTEREKERKQREWTGCRLVGRIRGGKYNLKVLLSP